MENIADLGIIIQARSGSTRLPSKMTLPFFNNHGILELLLSRLGRAGLADKIIVATTENSRDDIICGIARNAGVEYYRGNECDVLDRFIHAAKYYRVSKIIRVCADNPFLDIPALNELITLGMDTDMDYVSHCISSGIPTIKTHYGFWAEYVTVKALEKVAEQTNESVYHEHVTNYIYTHPDSFKIRLIPIPTTLEKRRIRLTIDTSDDFQMQQSIYNAVHNDNKDFQIKDVVDYLDRNAELYLAMDKLIETNEK